jgi:hypothetical protein
MHAMRSTALIVEQPGRPSARDAASAGNRDHPLTGSYIATLAAAHMPLRWLSLVDAMAAGELLLHGSLIGAACRLHCNAMEEVYAGA